MKDYNIVVGVFNPNNHIGRQHLGLAEAVAKEGFKVEIAPSQYPRDRYVFHQGKYSYNSISYSKQIVVYP